MTKPTQARVEARAWLNAVLMGAGIGTTTAVALTSVYLAGGLAHDAVAHSRTAHLANAASHGFSQDTLAAMARSDPSALAIALRYDPNLLNGYGARERDAEQTQLAARLDAKAQAEGDRPSFMRASLGPYFRSGVSNPAAQPFRLGALDQSRQLDCLAQAVYYEARGETPAGQAAVAQVVLNRVRHPAFPKSICAVVYQGAQMGRGCQFSFACDGSMRRHRDPAAWRRAEKVAEKALGGHVMAAVGNSTHFHVTSVSPGWGGSLLRVNQIGMHIFYRFGGRSGAPGAFTAKPRDDKPEAILASMTVLPAEAPSAAAGGIVGAFMRVEQPAQAAAPTTPTSPPKADAAEAHGEPISAKTTAKASSASEPLAAKSASAPSV